MLLSLSVWNLDQEAIALRDQQHNYAHILEYTETDPEYNLWWNDVNMAREGGKESLALDTAVMDVEDKNHKDWEVLENG